METVKVRLGSSELEVELADSFLKQFWGLSLRSEGKMLFDFGGEAGAMIDMALLSEPLYLYFIDSDNRVFEVQRAEPWSFDPRSWNLYRPERPYRYLLESFEELDVEEGESLEFMNG